MTKKKKQTKPETSPDGRGKRPTDPNQLAKWIMEQTTSGQGGLDERSDTEDETGNKP